MLDSRYARAEDVDALKEAIHKKPRISITLAETYQEQGRKYLEEAEILPRLDGILVALNPDHATALADAVTADVLAAQTASRQAPVQQLMVALANEVQGLVHLPGRCYVDTSRTGLPLLPAGRLAKPDLAGCEGHPSASAVSIINEAKPSLATPKHDQEAAYQVVQRALQLQVQQPQRSKWVFASLGRDSVRIFLIETDAQVLHTMPARPTESSYLGMPRVFCSNCYHVFYMQVPVNVCGLGSVCTCIHGHVSGAILCMLRLEQRLLAHQNHDGASAAVHTRHHLISMHKSLHHVACNSAGTATL